MDRLTDEVGEVSPRTFIFADDTVIFNESKVEEKLGVVLREQERLQKQDRIYECE